LYGPQGDPEAFRGRKRGIAKSCGREKAVVGVFEMKAKRYRHDISRVDPDKMECNEKFLYGLRLLPEGSTVAILDQRLLTAKKILDRYPDLHVLIVERSEGEHKYSVEAIRKGGLSGSVSCIHGDLFKVLESETRDVHALWIDSMSQDVHRSDLLRVCRAHPELTFIAVTITMRSRTGYSFNKRMYAMDATLREIVGLGCYTAWGYHMGCKGCSMGLLLFDKKHGKGRFDRFKVLYRPRSAVALLDKHGKKTGWYLVRWYGFKDTSIENWKTVRFWDIIIIQ
jgi:hypothetical protein